MTRIQLISILVSLLFLAVTFDFVRRRKIKEEYSLIWFFSGLTMLLFSVFSNLLTYLAELVGIFYAPAVLIPVTVFFGVILCLHFSIVISKHAEDKKKLSQEIALLRYELEQLKQKR